MSKAGSVLSREIRCAAGAGGGYDDHELWWERQIEQRRDMVGFFEGIPRGDDSCADTSHATRRRRNVGQMRQNSPRPAGGLPSPW
jgi:hypothetical protein